MTVTLAEARSKLCHRCDSVVVDALFQRHSWSRQRAKLRLPPSGWKFVDIGRLDENDQCAMCKLLHAIKVNCNDPQHKDFKLFWYNRTAKPSDEVRGDVRVYCTCQNFHRIVDLKGRWLVSTVSEAGQENDSTLTQVRRITRDSIDYVSLRRWLSVCESDHSEKCLDVHRDDPSQDLVDLRLINCHSRTVVAAGPGWRYSTLSYVWGPGRGEDQGKPTDDGLPAVLPLTIEDALEVTRQLGLRYIWIDRFCIDQDDRAAKMVQIRQMHRIYQASEVTITAAAGKDPSYGLPGVSRTARQYIPEVELGVTAILAHPLEGRQTVQRSAWTSRAWTFQERYFARRRLFFTDEQVFFECQRGAEEELSPVDKGLTENRITASRVEIAQHDPEQPWKIEEYLAEYSARSLTFDSDAINAIQGVFQDFARGRCPLKQFWGIPITPVITAISQDNKVERRDQRQNDGLVAGLCWRNRRPGRRRPQFPSWSWAGWACALDVNHKELQWGLDVGSEEEKACPEVFVEKSDGSLMNFDDCVLTDNPPESSGFFIHLETWIFPIEISADGEVNFEVDDSIVVRYPVLLLEQSEEDTMQNDTKAPRQKETLGLVLSNQASGPFGRFIMIVRSEGDYFRRVGCARLNGQSVSVTYKESGEKVCQSQSDEHKSYVEMCIRGKQRRRIRLG